MEDIILIITLILFSVIGFFVMWLIDIEINNYRKKKYKKSDLEDKGRKTYYE